MLRVKNAQIVNEQDEAVHLRGTCVGGWMNMENFINGYPGAEHSLRTIMADVIGSSKAQFFFDRLLDYFLADEDFEFIRSAGATVVRLPLNYRHFESDAAPFRYLETGFQRLDAALARCATHGLYAILDLHSVQGWQNTDWHCDNNHRQSFFWTSAQDQDRFIALWAEFARRYQGNATIAGYNIMNEPQTFAPFGRFGYPATRPRWEVINAIYQRTIRAIRAIDPDHIIFLEGDQFSTLFEGFDPPSADNLVYSSHNYTAAGFGPGSYPGNFNGVQWDSDTQERVFGAHEGTRFTQQHHVPLWVGEFGSVYNGPHTELEDRLQALRDQIEVFQRHAAHWTTWTYKDVGVMGWAMLDPESDYMQIIRPILNAKTELKTDFWMRWLPPTQTQHLIETLARHLEQTLHEPAIDPNANQVYLAQQALDGYAGELMQYSFARCFQGLSETRLDEILQSFALRNCQQNEPMLKVLSTFLGSDAANGKG